MSDTHSTTPAAKDAADDNARPASAPAPEQPTAKFPYNTTVIFYAVLTAIMLAYTLMAFGMDWTSHGGERMGPGFFPRLIGSCAVALSVIGLITSLRQKPDSAEKAPTNANSDSKGHPVLLALIALGMAAFLGLFIPLGAFLTGVAFLLLVYYLIDRERLGRRAILSVIFPLFLFVLFELWLQAGLPGGITDFL